MVRARSFVLALLLAGSGAAATVACSQGDVAGVDTTSADIERQELRVELQRVKEEVAALRRVIGVGDAETANFAQALAKRADQVARLESEVTALKAQVARGVASASSSDGDGNGESVPVVPAFQPAPDGTFTEEQLATFGKIFDEHQKKREMEQQLTRLRQELTKASITLTPEQEAAVVRLQKQYQERRTELYRSAQGQMQSDVERQALRAKTEELRAQFETEIRAAMPASEADKVVEALKRGYPGFFPRTDRMDIRPGMGR